VLVAINAASVVIVFVIYFYLCFGCLVVIAGQPLWPSKRNFLWGLGGLFLTFLSENCRGKFLKEVCIALLAGLLKG